MDFPETLFDLPLVESRTKEPVSGRLRLRRPQRDQKSFTFHAIDDLLPPDHIARTVWEIISKLDLSVFLNDVKTVEGASGRPPMDPHIYLGLWVLATIEGIGSARTLDRYCSEHHAFIWMLGGQSTNYHSLSDFRNQGDKLETLLSRLVASLIHQEIVSTQSWSHDGMRVRANAGASSFRRKKSLIEAHEEAKRRVQKLKEESQSEASNLSVRQKVAKERAAEEREKKCSEALKVLNELEKNIDKRRGRSKKKKKELKENSRVSTTDSEARKMKMPNGGYNPAYNVQYVTDNSSRMIVGVRTVNEGSDSGLLKPMLEHVYENFGFLPENWLADGGFVSDEGLRKAEEYGVKVFMPIPDTISKKINKEKLLNIDSPANRCLERMATEEGKNLYKNRASTAEFSNASTRNKGFYQFGVRGLFKAHATSLLYAIVHNISRIISIFKSNNNILINLIKNVLLLEC